jgi:hypothetical protein
MLEPDVERELESSADDEMLAAIRQEHVRAALPIPARGEYQGRSWSSERSRSTPVPHAPGPRHVRQPGVLRRDTELRSGPEDSRTAPRHRAVRRRRWRYGPT